MSLLPQAESGRFLSRLTSLPMLTDTDPFLERSTRILALARNHALSSYDATYLELAQRLGAALASFDRQLNRAAGTIGVALFSECAPSWSLPRSCSPPRSRLWGAQARCGRRCLFPEQLP
ncbi:MAG: type II toxin-antitoxin system VapC family toxin [Cyanobacteriota bacterium]|nr:type II toxin-antitoxin system VapC family toxin [Cyanobacteriota bacterium]